MRQPSNPALPGKLPLKWRVCMYCMYMLYSYQTNGRPFLGDVGSLPAASVASCVLADGGMSLRASALMSATLIYVRLCPAHCQRQHTSAYIFAVAQTFSKKQQQNNS